jgi:phosphatidylglycerol---prolipoprotein diacylglyceryl transferase
MDGILLEVEPVIWRLGPLSVRWYSLLLLSALGLGGLLAVTRASRLAGIGRGVALDLLSWTLLAGLVGARALHLLEYWGFYALYPGALIDLGNGGLSAWGGLLGGGATLALLARRRGLRFSTLADAIAPALISADALAQVGCFLNGDGEGQPADLPWATHYRDYDAMTPDFGVPRHPAQLYQLLADLVILGLLLLLRKRPLPPGARAWLWCGLYGLSRATIGLVRLDPPLLLGLQLAQLLGLLALVAAVLNLALLFSRPPRPALAA